MKLKTLISHQEQLQVAEVELEIIPGLPQIHYLGLPDRVIKESFYRTKAALKSAGFSFPVSKQVIVNVKPNHLRKSSRGLELAVALGLLVLTEQIAAEDLNPEWIIYGELGLDGRVYEPSDLALQFQNENHLPILTGESLNAGRSSQGPIYRLKALNSSDPISIETKAKRKWIRPEFASYFRFTNDEAQFLKIISLTGLHSLLAGAAGQGKSTLARSLVGFLKEPSSDTVLQDDWYPVIEAHSSVTPAAFLGGGSQLFAGEIERIKNGVLILDELLEFESEILDHLRGPMTGQVLRLARSGQVREIQPTFKVVATTNFCPCGKWTPKVQNISCRFSRLKCHRYLDRLSGPLVDRFGVMYFYDSGSQATAKRQVLGSSILNDLSELTGWYNQTENEASEAVTNFYQGISPRRWQHLTLVARVFAAERKRAEVGAEKTRLNEKVPLTLQDFRSAEVWALAPFQQLERGMS